jgi:hypothetical protein
MANVFVAPKIKIGFQNRTDTFIGKLAYVIYYDEKGKLRKEKSWQSWRDKSIEPQDFDNVPTDGFTINKDIKRYSGEWFSSTRTMIRVHDPRGFEFEITTENLIGILMHTDCLRRGLIGSFVYAWVGPELVLLPTNSEEYKNAVKYTIGLSKKVATKELVPGISYKTKREGDVIYMGKLNWFEYPPTKSRYGKRVGLRGHSKVHVFTTDGETFTTKDSMSFLAEANSNVPVSNFAELMDNFNKKVFANKIIKFEFRPATFNPDIAIKQYSYQPSLIQSNYFIDVGNGLFTEQSVEAHFTREYQTNLPEKFTLKGYEVVSARYPYHYESTVTHLRPENGEIVEVPCTQVSRRNYSPWHQDSTVYRDLAYMQALKLLNLYIIFENGEEKQVKYFNQLTNENF